MSGLVVVERGTRLEFGFEALMRFHGVHSPGGVAHAYKVLELALPLIASGEQPPERREIRIRTAFGGPGARDGFELVTRAVSDGRYEIDETLAEPERGRAAERFVFELSHRGRTATLHVRDGIVSDEFIDLARRRHRTEEHERRLEDLKRDMAARLRRMPATDVYDVVDRR